MWWWILFFAVFFIKGSGALCQERTKLRKLSKNKNMKMLNENDRYKPKTVPLSDIGSLFGDNSKTTGNSITINDNEDGVYDGSDDDEKEMEENYLTNADSDPKTLGSEQMPAKDVKVTDNIDSNSKAITEILVLQRELSIAAQTFSITIEDLGKTDHNIEDIDKKADHMMMYPDDDETEYFSDSDLGNLDLNKVLDSVTGKRVLDSITLTDSPFASAKYVTPRTLKYDPTDTTLRDPMQYGAYRRWKMTEDSKLDSKGNLKKKTKKSKGYQVGDYNVDGVSGASGGKVIGVRDVNGINDNKKKGGKKGSLNIDNFYNAVKNFGSGGEKDGALGGTGTVEPPGNKKPIQPLKALTKKNRKKIITPDDINDLFSDNNKNRETGRNNDDNSIEISNSNRNGIDIDDKNNNDGRSFSNLFDPTMRDNDEKPQWLLDADEEVKESKKMKGKKRKALTDNWKFWVACITGVGFISAFLNIYQKTGGFGSSGSELII